MAELTADDMLYPRVGQLKAEVLWPAKTMAQSTKLAKAALGELLKLGYTQADKDGFTGSARNDGAQHWTACLAYGGRYQQIVGLPSTVDVRDEGSSSYLVTQMNLMAELRDQELAAYAALIASQAVAGTGTTPRSSQSVRACFELI